MRPLHVVHVIDSLALGGAERVAVELANRLNDEDDLRVSLWATRKGGPMERAVADGVEWRVLGRRWRWDVAGLWEFRRWARQQRVDVFHSHGRGSMELVSSLRASRAVKGAHVFHDHRATVTGDSRPGASWRSAVRWGVDACVFVDQEQRAWAVGRAGIPPDKAMVVPNGIDLNRFVDVQPVDLRATVGARDGDLVVAMVANLRSGKGHPVALEAFGRCRVRDRIRLALVGSDVGDADRSYRRRCDELITSSELTERTRHLGPRVDVPALLAGCDAGLLASQRESGPITLLEYMAAGLPWVATRTGQLARAVEGSGTGFVVPPEDPDAMASALERLATMPPRERAAMGKRGQAVAADFDWGSACQRLKVLYQRVASGAAPFRAPHRSLHPH